MFDPLTRRVALASKVTDHHNSTAERHGARDLVVISGLLSTLPIVFLSILFIGEMVQDMMRGMRSD